jgi:hypothetical protein
MPVLDGNHVVEPPLLTTASSRDVVSVTHLTTALFNSSMAENASGPADRSVQVKLVLLG